MSTKIICWKCNRITNFFDLQILNNSIKNTTDFGRCENCDKKEFLIKDKLMNKKNGIGIRFHIRNLDDLKFSIFLNEYSEVEIFFKQKEYGFSTSETIFTGFSNFLNRIFKNWNDNFDLNYNKRNKLLTKKTMLERIEKCTSNILWSDALIMQSDADYTEISDTSESFDDTINFHIYNCINDLRMRIIDPEGFTRIAKTELFDNGTDLNNFDKLNKQNIKHYWINQ